jgi:hypothetical protein
MGNLQPFELFEDLEPRQKAPAVLLQWDGQKYVRSKEKIELYDFVGSHGNRGDRGYCFLSSGSNRWEAVSGLFEQVSSWTAM